MSCGINIWQFPHSDREFPPHFRHDGIVYDRSWKLLRHWIDHEVRLGLGRPPGRYYIPDAEGKGLKGYAGIAAGDIALFVKNRYIVGRGIVRTAFTKNETQRFPLSGGTKIPYVGNLDFDPDSLVIFEENPPPHQGIIGPGGGDPGYGGPGYRGPQFGRAWPLTLEQHKYVQHMLFQQDES